MNTTMATTTTVYFPGGKRCELVRSTVERMRDQAKRDAAAIDAGRMYADLDYAARCDWERAYKREAVRLTNVLACIDGGVAELPAALYP